MNVRFLTEAGEDSFTFTADDGTTGSNVATVSIVVRRLYSFQGFASPVDGEPTVNRATAGQTVPVKWRITSTDGVPISDPASFKSLTSHGVSCGPLLGAPVDGVEAQAAGSSGLRYLGDGSWQLNWKIPAAYSGQCGRMVLTLSDGSAYSANFRFK